VAYRRLCAKTQAGIEIEEDIADEVRHAETDDQRLAPLLQGVQLLDVFDNKTRRFGSVSAKREQIHRHASQICVVDKSMCLQRGAQVGRLRGGTSPPQHRHISGLAMHDRRFNSSIDALWGQLRVEGAIEQWERDIGERPQQVGVIVQFSLSPLAKRWLGLSGAEALQWVRRFMPRAVEMPEQRWLILDDE
jgi:hypothetical protein